ncbi:Hypothetical protein IALB_2226 [Ignavibacterium album JCM 16511]|uniref:Lipoprotein n=1 Tax=Ignavibacterium album (strain DSM 19864 / JCM 16511 / NBRC 101810 / Mat9-16) TaxID=945713 RepID=I0ALS2_IGNAJ|nr:hypothetical protein [Ignavibacterium album]AFH49929.1 Hypothetical protein IALB_2226 [Ignavibacterium album JCM 16511]
MKLVILSILLLAFTSCREEILEPYNPAGNVNQPFEENKLNYLNLVMTASDLTYDFEINLNFNSSDSRILISVVDFEKGNFTLNVLNENRGLIYVASIETEIPNLIDRIQGNIPKKVRISCKEFSGKVRVQLSKTSQ